MSHFEAQVIKEDNHYVFHFPDLEQGRYTVEEASFQARSWIEEHQDRVSEGSDFFLRFNQHLIKIN